MVTLSTSALDLAVKKDLAAINEEVATVTDRVAANQADSTAVDTAAMVVDFNALLDKLKAAGLMVAD